MGNYLEHPNKTKHTTKGFFHISKDKDHAKDLEYGASEMQGWRKTMEDAHITACNLEEKYDVPPGTAVFAVFDGHGGQEVAKFCGRHYVDVLFSMPEFKNKEYEKALKESFYKMDVLLQEPQYKDELNSLMAKPRTESLEVLSDSEDESFESKINSLRFDESSDKRRTLTGELSDFEVISDSDGSSEDESDEYEETEDLVLPFSLTKEETELDWEFDTEKGRMVHEMTEGAEEEDFYFANSAVENAPSLTKKKRKSVSASSDGHEKDEKTSGDDISEFGSEEDASDRESDDESPPPLPPRPGEETPMLGDLPASLNASSRIPFGIQREMREAEQSNGLSKSKAMQLLTSLIQLAKSSPGMLKRNAAPKALNNRSATEIPEGGSFETPMNQFRRQQFLQMLFARREEDCDAIFANPDSLQTSAGCTANVCLIIEGKIYTANVGDSRAVVCLENTVKALSVDHKPTHRLEKARIEAAGGFITKMGRICGNLNLSRTIGDLRYKGNPNLARDKQLITADADVTVHEITDKDEFIVLACDGVWDLMTNSGLRNFFNSRLRYPSRMPITAAIEAIFEECICSDPKRSNGLGGDNMTCVLATLCPLKHIQRKE